MIFKCFVAIILECCLVICILIFWFADFLGSCIVIVECLFFVVIHFQHSFTLYNFFMK